MNDPAVILTEDQTLALLRAGRSGTQPPLADPTATAIQRGHRMRLRRHAGRAGAGIALVAAAAVVFTIAMPGENLAGRSVVEPADGVPPNAPAETGPDDATLHLQNLRILKASLGKDFQRQDPDSKPQTHDWLILKPGSTTARALPTGYAADARVRVFGSARDNVCDPAAPPDRSGATCTSRELPGGRTVVLRSGSAPLEASAPVEIRHVYFTQADGDVLDVSLSVSPDLISREEYEAGKVPRAAVKAWLAPFEAKLIAAATDPKMAPGSVAARERAEAAPGFGAAVPANLRVLGEALGSKFRIAESATSPAFEYLALEGGGGLPAGYTADARFDVAPQPARLSPSAYGPQLEDPAGQPMMCGHSEPQGPDGRCQTRGLDDGRRVSVVTNRPAFYDPTLTEVDAGVPVELRQVQHKRDNVVLTASLFVRPTSNGPIDRSDVPQDAIASWLASFEEALISAVTDPRIQATTPTADDSNDTRLQRALGSDWVVRSDGVEAVRGGPAAAGLPHGMHGLAGARVFVRNVPLAQLCPTGAEPVSCQVRTLSNGLRAVVMTSPVERWPIGDTFASIGILFRRSGGEVVSVYLSTRGPTQPGDAAAIDQQIQAWLAAHEDALLEAAVDPEMAQPPGYFDPRR